MSQIRKYEKKDWPQLWLILKNVFHAGETYAVPTDISETEAKRIWIEIPLATFVIVDENNIIGGSYYIKPNQPGPGSHVCNCGYVVSANSRGKGFASAMCIHSQAEAVSNGFFSMQYDLVVSKNIEAVNLWRKHNFEIIGTIPSSFQHPIHGFVDSHVMYKILKQKNAADEKTHR